MVFTFQGFGEQSAPQC